MKNLQYGPSRAINCDFFNQIPIVCFYFLSGRIISIFTKSSSGKLTEDLEIMLTVNKFYRYFNITIFFVSALDVISYEFLLRTS